MNNDYIVILSNDSPEKIYEEIEFDWTTPRFIFWPKFISFEF